MVNNLSSCSRRVAVAAAALLLSVLCAVSAGAPCKRGLAYDFRSTADLGAFSSVSWWHNWSPTNNGVVVAGKEFVPMLWGGTFDVPTVVNQVKASGGKYLLTFNTPNFKYGPNMTAEAAAAAWARVEDVARQAGILGVASPAVNYCGPESACQDTDPVRYLQHFFGNCTAIYGAKGCRVDYVSVLNYNCLKPSLQGYLNLFRAFGKPIWLTEFACNEGGTPTVAMQQTLMTDAMPFLDTEPMVFRYSWAAGRNQYLAVANTLSATTGVRTALGDLYNRAPNCTVDTCAEVKCVQLRPANATAPLNMGKAGWSCGSYTNTKCSWTKDCGACDAWATCQAGTGAPGVCRVTGLNASNCATFDYCGKLRLKCGKTYARPYPCTGTVTCGTTNCVSSTCVHPKRGMAYDFRSTADLSAFSSVSWWYNWSPTNNGVVVPGKEFVAMLWNGNFDIPTVVNQIKASGAKYLLGFNEPNFKWWQANMSAETAAKAWPRVEDVARQAGIIGIASPAVNFCGPASACHAEHPVAYLQQFFGNCTKLYGTKGCRVDYIALHNYMCHKSALQWYLDLFRKFGKPIWLTEFACDEPQYLSLWKQHELMRDALPYLELEPMVFRYAWFSARSWELPTSNALTSATGVRSTLGEIYNEEPVCDAEPPCREVKCFQTHAINQADPFNISKAGWNCGNFTNRCGWNKNCGTCDSWTTCTSTGTLTPAVCRLTGLSTSNCATYDFCGKFNLKCGTFARPYPCTGTVTCNTVCDSKLEYCLFYMTGSSRGTTCNKYVGAGIFEQFRPANSTLYPVFDSSNKANVSFKYLSSYTTDHSCVKIGNTFASTGEASKVQIRASVYLPSGTVYLGLRLGQGTTRPLDGLYAGIEVINSTRAKVLQCSNPAPGNNNCVVVGTNFAFANNKLNDVAFHVPPLSKYTSTDVSAVVKVNGVQVGSWSITKANYPNAGQPFICGKVVNSAHRAYIANIVVASAWKIDIVLVNCTSRAGWEALARAVFAGSTITIIQRPSKMCTSAKRDGAEMFNAAELVIEDAPGMPAATQVELAKLAIEQGALQSVDPALEVLSIGELAPLVETGASAATGAVAAGLSTAAIVGIAVGATVATATAAAAATAGVVYAKNRSSSSSPKEDEKAEQEVKLDDAKPEEPTAAVEAPAEEEPPKKKPTFGVNIMNFVNMSRTSITGRSPPVKVVVKPVQLKEEQSK